MRRHEGNGGTVPLQPQKITEESSTAVNKPNFKNGAENQKGRRENMDDPIDAT